MFSGVLLQIITWKAVHAILAALTFFGGAAFWVLYNIHQRLTTLEENQGERKTAIYGDDDNPLHVGLTKEVAALKEEVDELHEDVTQASQDREELHRRIVRVEEKLERVLEELEDED